MSARARVTTTPRPRARISVHVRVGACVRSCVRVSGGGGARGRAKRRRDAPAETRMPVRCSPVRAGFFAVSLPPSSRFLSPRRTLCRCPPPRVPEYNTLQYSTWFAVTAEGLDLFPNDRGNGRENVRKSCRKIDFSIITFESVRGGTSVLPRKFEFNTLQAHT